MNSNQVFPTLRKRWKMILLVFAVGIGLATALTLVQTPIYKASTQLFVSAVNTDTTTSLNQGNSFAESRVQSYIAAATSRDLVTDSVSDYLKRENGWDYPAGTLSKKITATAPNGKVLITISVTDPSPGRAAAIADAVAKRFVYIVQFIETPGSTNGQDDPYSPFPRPSTSAPASPTSTPAATPTPTPTPTVSPGDTNSPPAPGTSESGVAPTGTDVTPTGAQSLVNNLQGGAAAVAPGPTPSSTSTAPGEAPTPLVKVTVLQSASVPRSPDSPNAYLNLGVGGLAGLILGLALAFLREVLDNTFKSSEQIAEFTNLPVLGSIPWDKQAPNTVVAFRAESRGQRAESFRHLRTNLDFVSVGSTSNILAVTSALPGEGKTSTAINIAVALAEGGQRVCLVEADLRKPSFADKLGLVRDVGLTSVLIGRAELEDVLQNAGANLAVLTSGEIPPNPSELLRSANFRALLDYISSRVDRVIVDAAPLLPVADGAEVASEADETLLVVRSGKTTRDQVRRAKQTLANVGVTPVGVILSMARARLGGYEYYQYYGNAEPTKRNRPERNPAVEATPSTDEAMEDALEGVGKHVTGGTADSDTTADAAADTTDSTEVAETPAPR